MRKATATNGGITGGKSASPLDDRGTVVLLCKKQAPNISIDIDVLTGQVSRPDAGRHDHFGAVPHPDLALHLPARTRGSTRVDARDPAIGSFGTPPADR